MNDNNEELFSIGEVIATWGVHGEIKIRVLTDFPKRFKKGSSFLIDGIRYNIETVKKLNDGIVLKLEGIDTPEAALPLKNKKMKVTEAELQKLPKGMYYRHQIIGLTVITEDGEKIGEISEIIETNANNVYVVRSDGREALIPAKGNIIKEINIENGTMTIEMVKGLFNK
jgi:16S rRNA processing protein RimM